jgi:hypothetical protein
MSLHLDCPTLHKYIHLSSTHLNKNTDRQTGVFAWTKNYYGPVSGNWCWIEQQYARQRYTLNHGWRFAIFLISLCTYIYVFIYMSRRLRPQNVSNLSSTMPDDLEYEKLEHNTRDNAVLAGCGATPRISVEDVDRMQNSPGAATKKHRRAVSSFSFARKLQVDTAAPARESTEPMVQPQEQDLISPRSPDETFVLVDMEKALPPTPRTTTTRPPLHRETTARADARAKVDRDIWRILLLNMYPVTYLILWLPGIANRIAEGMGHQVRVLVILQSSTQFIGLANASVYLYKEHRRDIREWWAGMQGRKAARAAKAAAGSGDAASDGDSGRLGYWRSVTP